MTTDKSSSAVHHFSWEEWDHQMVVIIYRSDRRFVVKRYVERVLANSTAWQQLARSSFANLLPIPRAHLMTENEVKLMHHIFAWHLDGTLKFPIIAGLDQLLDWEDVLDFIEQAQQTPRNDEQDELTATNSPSILPTIPVGISLASTSSKKKYADQSNNAENVPFKKGHPTPTKINKKPSPMAQQQLLDESTQTTSANHWVQINNICVPYIIKCDQTRLLPYQVILDCEFLNEQEQSFLIDFTVPANSNDIHTFERAISSASSINFSLGKDLLLIDLYHLIFGMSRIVYVKLMSNQRDVNKSYKTVLAQCGGLVSVHAHSIPFISLGKLDYILFDSVRTIFPSTTKTLSSLRRYAVPAQSHEIDYLRLVQLYRSRHHRDESILPDRQPHLLISTQELEKYVNKDELVIESSLTQFQQIEYQKMRKRPNPTESTSLKKPIKRKADATMADVQNTTFK